MRRDGLRIDPKARPYGMAAVDDLADLVRGLEVQLPPSLPEHGQRLLAALGVRVVFDRSARA